MPSTAPSATNPGPRRVLCSVVLGTILAALLWATVPLSNSVAGSYLRETHHVYLVATPGHIDAFDQGERPDLDGYSFVDPDAAAETLAKWERDNTRTNLFDRAKALAVEHKQPSHEWVPSLDRIDLEFSPARLDTLDLTLPWLRVLTLDYQAGNRDRAKRLAGEGYLSHETVAAEYLEKRAPWSSVGPLLAEHTYTFPRLELDPRFCWIPLLQIGLFLGTTLAFGIAVRETSRLRRRGRQEAPQRDPATLAP